MSPYHAAYTRWRNGGADRCLSRPLIRLEYLKLGLRLLEPTVYELIHLVIRRYNFSLDKGRLVFSGSASSTPTEVPYNH